MPDAAEAVAERPEESTLERKTAESAEGLLVEDVSIDGMCGVY
jgi:mycofactocin precursor